MIKAIGMMVLIMFAGLAQAAEHCPVLKAEGLSEQQVRVMWEAYQAGKKKDMAYSLAAIAWKESSAGRYVINLQDPSAGVFQITIDNALNYIKWEDTPFNRNRMAQMLVEDFDLSAEFAMINLEFWRDQYGEDWLTIWRSYNGGYSNSAASQKYAQDIARKIQKINLCNWG